MRATYIANITKVHLIILIIFGEEYNYDFHYLNVSILQVQWFSTCDTRTPGGTGRIGWGVRENYNIGNGGKHKKLSYNKSTKTKLWSFGLQRQTYVKIVTRLAHH
jgi:hypothetical protein